MEHIRETLETPVRGEYDVIVVGSGPAGMGAAVQAGRLGARVLLLEAQGTVGGISTSGLMSHFTGRGGSAMYFEVLRRMAERNYFEKGVGKPFIDPEMLKKIYFEMLEDAGAEVLLYTFVCGVIRDGDTVKGVIVENKTGRGAYLGKVIVDASGDGDVAAKAGAEYFLGREEDGRMQPATLMFKVGGVDMENAVLPPSFETQVPTEKGELQALAKKLLPHPAGHVLLYPSPIPGIVTCNMTNVTGIDGTKAEDLTRAEVVCRSQMEPIVEFLREYVPGYAHCYIISAASLIGIRETRHFKGVKTITEEDVLTARQFPDAVVHGAWFNFDVHNMTGSGLDKTGCQAKFTQQKGYTIPYGCMVPEKLNGLLLSGRNISGSHMAHSSFRTMPICMGIGEADGIAAALAVRGNIPLRDVRPEEIQEIQKTFCYDDPLK